MARKEPPERRQQRFSIRVGEVPDHAFEHDDRVVVGREGAELLLERLLREADRHPDQLVRCLRHREPRLLVAQQRGLVQLHPAASVEPEGSGVEAAPDHRHATSAVLVELAPEHVVDDPVANREGGVRPLQRREPLRNCPRLVVHETRGVGVVPDRMPPDCVRVSGGEDPEGGDRDGVLGRERGHATSIRRVAARVNASRAPRAARPGRARPPATRRR